MSYRLRTLMTVIAGLALPIYAVSESWKRKCLVPVGMVWTFFFVTLLVILIFSLAGTIAEDSGDKDFSVFWEVATFGYFLAVFLSLLTIFMSSLSI